MIMIKRRGHIETGHCDTEEEGLATWRRGPKPRALRRTRCRHAPSSPSLSQVRPGSGMVDTKGTVYQLIGRTSSMQQKKPEEINFV